MGFGRLRQRLLSTVKWAIAAPIVGAVLFQTAQWTNYFCNKSHPSELRRSFEVKYGFPINGWQSAIEGNPHIVSDLSDILDKELLQKPFGLGSVNIISRDWKRQDIIDHVYTAVNSESSVYFTPGTRNLNVLEETFRKEHAVDAIKALKLDDILAKSREIRNKWVYMQPEYDRGIPLSQPTITFAAFAQEPGARPASQAGFTPEQIDEQIVAMAKTGELNSETPEILYLRILNPSQTPEMKPNMAELQNAATLQKYGLLPREFLMHILLSKYGYNARVTLDHDRAAEYVTSSGAFLRKHPKSVYTAKIRLTRASLFQAMAELNPNKVYLSMAEDELKAALHAPYKEKDTHTLILTNLERLYNKEGDMEKAKKVNSAVRLFLCRRAAGDVKLATRGVNDYLEDSGVLPRATSLSQKPFK